MSEGDENNNISPKWPARSRRIGIRLYPAQFFMLQRAATAENMSVSDFIRWKLGLK